MKLIISYCSKLDNISYSKLLSFHFHFRLRLVCDMIQSFSSQKRYYHCIKNKWYFLLYFLDRTSKASMYRYEDIKSAFHFTESIAQSNNWVVPCRIRCWSSYQSKRYGNCQVGPIARLAGSACHQICHWNFLYDTRASESPRRCLIRAASKQTPLKQNIHYVFFLILFLLILCFYVVGTFPVLRSWYHSGA